jgi:hypothetical protein
MMVEMMYGGSIAVLRAAFAVWISAASAGTLKNERYGLRAEAVAIALDMAMAVESEERTRRSVAW